MDDYYSQLQLSDDLDDDYLFNTHVVRDSSELAEVDKLLKFAYAKED